MTSARQHEINKNLSFVRRIITDTCQQLGRTEPRLIAVSKKHSIESMRAAFHCGQREFGENYSQELAQKKSGLADLPSLKLVFVGRLQSNKINAIVANADEIQGLASEKHAAQIARAAKELGRVPYPVYYLVNVGDEATKDGLQLSLVQEFDQIIQKNYPELAIQGLMAIPPTLDGEPGQEIPPLYTELRALARQIGAGKLSIGMSADLRTAILAGTDCVRIGTAIFGERQ